MRYSIPRQFAQTASLVLAVAIMATASDSALALFIGGGLLGLFVALLND